MQISNTLTSFSSHIVQMNHCYGDLDPDIVIDYRSAAKDGENECKAKRLEAFKSALTTIASKPRKVVVLTCVEEDGIECLLNEGPTILNGASIQRLYIDPFHDTYGIGMRMMMGMAKLEGGADQLYKNCSALKNMYLTIREGFHERIK